MNNALIGFLTGTVITICSGLYIFFAHGDTIASAVNGAQAQASDVVQTAEDVKVNYCVKRFVRACNQQGQFSENVCQAEADKTCNPSNPNFYGEDVAVQSE